MRQFNSLLFFLAKVLAKICKISFVASLVTLYHLLRLLKILATKLNQIIQFVLLQLDVLEAPHSETSEYTTVIGEKTFSDQEIAEMAKSLPRESLTIKEIEAQLGVSYRQARKVKSELDKILNTPNIRAQYA